MSLWSQYHLDDCSASKPQLKVVSRCRVGKKMRAGGEHKNNGREVEEDMIERLITTKGHRHDVSGIKEETTNFSINTSLFLTTTHFQRLKPNSTLLSRPICCSLSSLAEASTIFKENPSSQQHPSGLLQCLYSWNKQSSWGVENDINIYHLIKGKTKTKETQGGSETKEADGSPGAGPAMHAG